MNTITRCWCDRSRYRPHPQTPEHGHGRTAAGSAGTASDGYRIPPAPDRPQREVMDPDEPGRRRPARTTPVSNEGDPK